MLDECKGERLWEVLTVLSTAVVRKHVKENEASAQTIVGRLAVARALSAQDRQPLLPLAIAHKGAMSALLRRKEVQRQSWRAFQSVMAEKEQELEAQEAEVRKMESLKGSSKARKDHPMLKERLQEHWHGDPRWLDIILHGEEPHSTRILNQSFSQARQIALEAPNSPEQRSSQPGLLEELEARVTAQQMRLGKWKEYQAQSGSPSKTPKVPKAWGSPWKTPRGANAFTTGGIGASGMTSTPLMTKKYQDFFQPTQDEQKEDEAQVDYENAEEEETPVEMPESKVCADSTPTLKGISKDSLWREDPSSSLPSLHATSRDELSSVIYDSNDVHQRDHLDYSSPCPRPKTPPNGKKVISVPNTPSTDGTSDLENWSDPEPTPHHHASAHHTNQDIHFGVDDEAPPSQEIESNSNLIAAQQPKLSLLERTRQSIALTTTTTTIRPHNIDASFLPDSSPTPLPRPAPQQHTLFPHLQEPTEPTLNRHASLLDRTRQSISSVPTRPRPPSSNTRNKPAFSANEFKTPKKKSRDKGTSPARQKLGALAEESGKDTIGHRSSSTSSSPSLEVDVDAMGLENEEEEEEDYESVFRSRPRLGTSPVGGETG